MAVHSAGLLVFRRTTAQDPIEVLVVHPGGPFWASKDAAAWSIPKGECAEGEDALATAEREFVEELGIAAPVGERLYLGELAQSRAKRVTVWAVEAVDGAGLGAPGSTVEPVSNTFEMEWPPRSGRTQEFPEVDRAEWFSLDLARSKLHTGQVPFLDRLLAVLA